MDLVFYQQGKLQDPKDTAIERQLKAMRQLLKAWPAAQRGELVSAWRLTWRRLSIMPRAHSVESSFAAIICCHSAGRGCS